MGDKKKNTSYGGRLFTEPNTIGMNAHMKKDKRTISRNGSY